MRITCSAKTGSKTAEQWKKAKAISPPVMITVANSTETAARIKFAFDHGKVHIDELAVPERTLHIDSNVLKQAESQDEPVKLIEPIGDDDDEDDSQPRKKQTKQERAELLRQTVYTVGQPGQPGEQIQNVISVRMLSEGWDAKTVTHIMGLRAFSSQLLCEQVVGRGLRRTSYEINPITGRFDPEYVNIFGVPFTFLPYEGETDTPPPPPLPKTRVEPLPKRERDYAISWPNIIRIEHVYTPKLSVDIASIPPLELNAHDTSTHAELAAILEGKTHLTSLTEIDLEELGRKFRLQKIIFETARDVFDQMKPSWRGTTDFLLPQIIRIVEQVLRSDRVRITPPLFNSNEIRRRVILTMNMNKIVQHVWNCIRAENTVRLEPVFDRQRPVLSTGDSRAWYTGRPCAPTKRSHINFCLFDSTWEASASFYMDRASNLVRSWVKNDHLGFEVLYVYQGMVRRYRPDFLIRLANDTHLVLEVKGQDSEEDQTKRTYLKEWVDAVNAYGGFGRWAWDVSFHPEDLEPILLKHVA